MNKTVFVYLLGLLVTLTTFAEDVAWQLDKNHSAVEFSVKHLMISTVKGNFEEFDGQILADPVTGKISSLTGTVQVKSVNTRIKARDEHLLKEEFFDAEKYPTMKFKSTAIKYDGANVEVAGELTIKDKTLPVTLKGTYNGVQKVNMGNGDMLHAGYTFAGQVNRKEFGLNFNAVTNGVIVVDDVVTVSGSLEITLPVAPAK